MKWAATFFLAVFCASVRAKPKSPVELVFEVKATEQEPLAATLAIVRARLQTFAGAKTTVRELNATRFVVGVPVATKRERVVRLVTMRGAVEFGLVVEDRDPVRKLAWERFQFARRAGAPLDAACRIAPAELSGAVRIDFPRGLRWVQASSAMSNLAVKDDAGAHWLLLECHQENVNESSFADVTVRRDTTGFGGGWLVLCSVRAAAQDGLARLTSNAGTKMAVVLDGVAIVAPNIETELRSAMQISLGPDGKALAREVAVCLGVARLQHPPQLVAKRKG